MFQKLSQSLNTIFTKWQKSTLSEKELTAVLHEIRQALIDADTALVAVDAFISSLKEKAKEFVFDKSATPTEQIRAMVHQSLVETLGKPPETIITGSVQPHVILLIGLQGAGKTTTAVKLALWLKTQLSKNVGVTSVDFQRPAAREQLEILAKHAQIPYFHTETQAINKIRQPLLVSCSASGIDTLIIDTAGRLSADDALMLELTELKNTFSSCDIFYVVDSQTGQDAAVTAERFYKKIHFNASILTKCDADSKGGVALSLRCITGRPIAFTGEGEKVENLHTFDPARIANRMLDLGDVASLVEKMKKSINEKDVQQQTQRMSQGQYDFNDLLAQTQQIKEMGGAQSIASMLPGFHNAPQHIKEMLNDDLTISVTALIHSMTPKERRHPALLQQNSRRERIIKGSGRSKKELSDLLKQFEKTKSLLKKLSPNKLRMAMQMMSQKEK